METPTFPAAHQSSGTRGPGMLTWVRESLQGPAWRSGAVLSLVISRETTIDRLGRVLHAFLILQLMIATVYGGLPL